MTENPVLRQRHNFAYQHLAAASRFARACRNVEQENAGQAIGAFFDEIIALASSSVILSAAALEANINEVFADARDGTWPLGKIEADVLVEIWELAEKKPTLDKYELVFALHQKMRMDKGLHLVQRVHKLVKVRNALMHWKPEWYDEQIEHARLAKRLHNEFPLSPFVGVDTPIFPTRCMSSGMAAWAVESTGAFITWFSRESRLPNRIERLGGMSTEGNGNV